MRICYDWSVDYSSFSKLECRMGLIRRFAPRPLQPLLLRIVPILKRMFYFGVARYCPVCRSWLRSFHPHKLVPEAIILCPVCGSLDRHRLAWLFLERKSDLFDGKPKKLLHIAPESEFETRFKRINGLDYLSGDLENPAMVKMDITSIQYPDDSFDVIICCHVLEHVPDDRKAMSELYRVLKLGGWLLVQVPQPPEVTKTFEDPSITDPDERRRLFYWDTHVRVYGPDLKDRLEEFGFTAKNVSWTDVVTPEETVRFGVKGQKLYYVTK